MIPTGRHSGRKALVTLAMGLLVSCIGCAPPEVHPVWPPPPAAPRVAHRKSIRTGADLVRPGWFRRLVGLVTGGQDVSLIRPHGVAVAEGRRLYVTDQERQAIVVFDLTSPRATVIDQIGEVFLISPVGIAVCGEMVAVSDSALKGVYLVKPNGTLVRALAKPGGFGRPTGLAYDGANGHLYVVDTLANEVCVFDVSTGRLVRRMGSPGTDVGQFHYPTHVFLDRTGKIYVADSLNFRVQVFSPDGDYLFHIGKHGDATGHLSVPKGIGVDRFGHIYVVDSHFGAVQVFDQKGAFLVAIGTPGKGNGEFRIPAGMAVDSQDRIYICDSYNSRVQLLQYLGGDHDERRPATSP